MDEAQDTSPQQWDVIDRLSQEFTSGMGAREAGRTIFVVGDKKQSIYSFQGADPTGFDRMVSVFGGRLKGVGYGLVETTLEHSFRSANAVLATVDKTLNASDGIGTSLHTPFWEDLPGRVDLWPLLQPQTEDTSDEDWRQPVDRVAETHHTIVLARSIAAEIKRMIDDAVAIPRRSDDDSLEFRTARAGDFLILFRSRKTQLFREVNRACKDAGLDIAGVDRIVVAAELVVRDIIAVLRFLSLPEDDLALAEALKSPIFGWSEQALFDLAHRRPEKSYLWAALRQSQEKHPRTLEILNDLRDSADFLRPFDLIERLLVRHEGRQKLVGRLGEEADDAIDAFLSQAMDYERLDVPSLTGFLAWLEAGEIEFKRQMDSAGDRIRVMTVHGAKGLESPVVILPDTVAGTTRVRDGLLPTEGDTGLIWKTTEEKRAAVERDAYERLKCKHEEERERLLYVAMTRAESWLIVCGAGKPSKGRGSWYERIEDGMSELGPFGHEFPPGPGKRFESGVWPEVADLSATVTETVAPTRIAGNWALQPAPPPVARRKTISPSDLGGAKALLGEGLDEAAALRRGRRIHLLLEHLPAAPRPEWAARAAALLIGEDFAQREEIDALLAEVTQVADAPDLAHLFATDSLAEVEITADLPGLGRIHGAIDRLIVEADCVVAIDFKSNTIIPRKAENTPEGLLRQMGAYAMALQQIYPEKRVETAILWTREARFMPMPHDLVIAALERAASP